MARRLSKYVSPPKGDRSGLSSQRGDTRKADDYAKPGHEPHHLGRFVNLPIFFAVLFTVLLWQDEVKAQQRDPHTFNVTTIADLNTVLSLQDYGGYTLQANDIVNFIMNVDTPRTSPYIVVSNESMTGTTASLAYALNSYKRGVGLWRLDTLTDDDGNSVNNASNLWAQGQNYFTIQGGTLELMRGSSITLQGADTRFVLSDGTTLNSRGGNAAGNSFINAASIVLGNNVSIGLDVTNAQIGSPILTLTGNTTLSNATNTGDLNLLGFTNVTTPITVQLLQYTYSEPAPEEPTPVPTYAAPPIRLSDLSQGQPGKAATYGKNYDLLVRGEDWNAVKTAANAGMTRLTGDLVVTPATPPGGSTTGTVLISLENFTSRVGLVNWVNSGAATADWNATTANWQGTGAISAANTFLHGDVVRFSYGSTQRINVQEGGVQIGNWYTDGSGSSYGMLIDGGTYTFANVNNSLIGIDGGGKVRIITADTRYKTAVTFSSANSYWGGTEVDNATLTLGHSGAVGTGALTLSNSTVLNFDTNLAVDIFYNDISVGTSNVQIVKRTGNDLTLDGAVTGTGQTIVEAGTLRKNITTGVLTVNDNATYHILGYNDDPTNFTTGSADYNAAIIARRYYGSRIVAGLQDGDQGGAEHRVSFRAAGAGRRADGTMPSGAVNCSRRSFPS